MRLELEAKRLEHAGNNNDGRRVMTASAKSPELPAFVDGKDDLDSYLLRFERYATIAHWNKEAWATQLSALLSGKALGVYSGLSQEEATDYDRLKVALLKRYNFTEHGYRQRFREAKPEGFESPGQFIVRLKNYFMKWVELSEVDDLFAGVVDLLVREQFTNSCSKDLSVYLKERSPRDLDNFANMAEQYLVAHNKRLSGEDAQPGCDVMENEDGAVQRNPPENGWNQQTRNLRCFICQGLGHVLRTVV